MEKIILYPFKTKDPFLNIVAGTILLALSLILYIPSIFLLGYLSRISYTIASDRTDTLLQMKAYKDGILFGIDSLAIIFTYYLPIVIFGFLSYKYMIARPIFLFLLVMFAITFPIIITYTNFSSELTIPRFINILLSSSYLKHVIIGFALLGVSGVIFETFSQTTSEFLFLPVLYVTLVCYFASVGYGIRKYTENLEGTKEL